VKKTKSLLIQLLSLLNQRFIKHERLRDNAPESFDSVFIANLIHVVENPSKALQECHRILRGRDRIEIVTFTGFGMSLWEKIKMGVRFSKAWGRPPAHTHSFSLEDVESMLGETGFVIEQSKLIGNRTKALFLVGRKN
jgi:SAM-dependent methyltransferase